MCLTRRFARSGSRSPAPRSACSAGRRPGRRRVPRRRTSMWPWIKRWRDWAMRDFWSMPRSSPQPQALHYSFEKAGLTLHDQPIPWNAEVVLVEALVRLGPSVARRKADFSIHLPGGNIVSAESLRQQTAEDRARIFFRFPPPPQTLKADFVWRDKMLGQLTLPVLSCDEFL